jgi:hypothetical protein
MEPLHIQHEPPRPGPAMPILRVKAGQEMHFVILSESLWGIWTHWAGNRSEPCFAENATCPGHKRGLPRRWKGYLHVWHIDKRLEAFIELTPTAAHCLLDQAGKNCSLRGLRLKLRRTGASNGRLLVNLLPANPSMEGFAQPKDPESILCKLWGVDRIITGRERDFTLDVPGEEIPVE